MASTYAAMRALGREGYSKIVRQCMEVTGHAAAKAKSIGLEAVKKPVKLGISDDTHYVVLSGLEEGEQVITGPFRILSRTLKDDDLLEFEDKKKENKDAN